MITLLKDDGFAFLADLNDAYNFTIQISTGEIHFDEMVAWLQKNTAIINSTNF